MIGPRQHVERILDEEPGRTVEVIVQMGAPSLTDADVRAALRDIEARHLATSAREVLPRPVRDARAAAIGTGTEQGGVPNARPRRSPARSGAPAPTVGQLRRQNQAVLEPLLASEPVRRRQANTPDRAARLWVARSAYLELDRDDLARLPDEVDGIRVVDRNRSLRLPPAAATAALPDAVLESSAASWGIEAAGALATWGAFGARGAGTTVGVLDTGVDATHPDLRDRVKYWAEFAADGTQVADSQPHDTGNHGTHVCGTVAGGNASGQWIGMAPEADLAVGMVLGGGSGTTDQVIAGLTWAVELGVDVLNLSLSSASFGHVSPSIFTEAFITCLRAGIPVVAAMGNRGEQTGASTGSDLFSYAVGALDHRGVPAGFSGGHTQSWQPPGEEPPVYYIKPDVSAPGAAVVSTVPGGSWEAKNGTSMATPHVAGAVALLLSAVPEIRTERSGLDRALYVQKIISGSVDDLGEAGQDARYGQGRLNILRAIALARQ